MQDFSELIKAYNRGEDVFEPIKAILLNTQTPVEQHVVIIFWAADRKDLRILASMLDVLDNLIDHYEIRNQTIKKWLAAGFDIVQVFFSAFTKFQDDSVVDALIECFDVDDFATEAIITLGKIGSDYAFQRLLYRLGRGFAWWDEYAMGRNALMDAVASFGARAYEPLIAILENTEEHRHRRELAAATLCKLGDSRVADDFLRMLDNAELSKILRESYVMYNIHLLNDPRFFKPILRKLEAGEVHSGHCGGIFNQLASPEQLMALIYHSKQEIQRLAIHALGEQRVSEAVQPLLALKADAPQALQVPIMTALEKINQARI
jgi:HEAT repeat protein